MKEQLLKLAGIGISLYLISTGLSYAAFTTLGAGGSAASKQMPKVGSPTPKGKQGHFVIDPSIPRTEECPMNGKMYTKQEKDTWAKRRPIVIMIENSTDARPQSGLSYADITYEAVAEGGITRFASVFYCGIAAETPVVAPVRSVRVYFIYPALEYGNPPILMHIGGANDFGNDGKTADKVRALEILMALKWRVPGGIDLDTTFDTGFPVFTRNENRLGREVAVEHTMQGRLDKAIELAAKRGWTNLGPDGSSWDKNFKPWKFTDDITQDKRPQQYPIAYSFSSNFESDYRAKWEYDPTDNSYKRFTANQPHKDLEVDEQLRAKNVVIQFAKEEVSIDENVHMYYEMMGSGKALIFQNGTVIPARWSKLNKNSRTIFTEEKTGKEISFVRGTIWISVLGTTRFVEYGTPATP